MAILNVRLFGRFRVWHGDQLLGGFDGAKVQELFCYLLLNRARPQPRESLAGLLWGDNPTAQARKYLRQTLWQLQTALEAPDTEGGAPVLQAGADWVELKAAPHLWLDVAAFEQAYHQTQGVPGAQLDTRHVALLEGAIGLYQGNLLEGRYQDWCLFERERLQNLQLAMLDKLMRYCEATQAYDRGLTYGAEILRFDRARECTHRRLMRLYYLAGDRTGGLRQFQRCVEALSEELDVPPARRTVALYEQIRADTLEPSALAGPRAQHARAASLHEALDYLKQIQAVLGEGQRQLGQQIKLLERQLGCRP